MISKRLMVFMYVQVLAANKLPGAICSLVTGATDIGEAIAKDERLPLVSFTGSCLAGQKVSKSIEDTGFSENTQNAEGKNTSITVGKLYYPCTSMGQSSSHLVDLLDSYSSLSL